MHAITAVSAQNQSPVVTQPRLVQAAHEFEAQLMKELLKPMTSDSGMEGEESDGGSGALADFATEALGQSLSSHGGLGIATSILRDLSRNETATQLASHPGKGAGNPSLNAIGELK